MGRNTLTGDIENNYSLLAWLHGRLQGQDTQRHSRE